MGAPTPARMGAGSSSSTRLPSTQLHELRVTKAVSTLGRLCKCGAMEGTCGVAAVCSWAVSSLRAGTASLFSPPTARHRAEHGVLSSA